MRDEKGGATCGLRKSVRGRVATYETSSIGTVGSLHARPFCRLLIVTTATQRNANEGATSTSEMHRWMSMTRFKAAIIHLFGSAAVLALIFALVRFVWYPEPFFSSASGINLMRILVPIDLILGPLITLIIFNPKKASLKFDLTCVLVCQIAFLCYGLWAIYLARPVYVAYDEGWFRLVLANEVEPQDRGKAKLDEFKSLPLLGPRVIGTIMPTDPAKRAELVLASASGGGVQYLPEYYVPYHDVATMVRAAAQAAQEVKHLTPEERERVFSYERKMDATGRHVRFVPLRTRTALLFVAVDPSSGAVIEVF